MHKIYRLYLTIIFCLGIATPAWAEDLFVISHPNMVLTSDNIRDVFLGEKQFAGSTKIIPVANNAAQADFLSKVVKISPSRYSTAWTKKAFRDGLTQPVVKSGDAEVIHFVKSTPGAVGYVTSQPPGVTVINKY
jgi:ABC-type phosphate transport system substrate-binding protein